jgi:hypothetical protein
MTTPEATSLAPLAVPKRQYKQWLIDFRFVREVERLEREGRVKSRGHLEETLGMSHGAVALIRQGRLTANAAHIAELKRVYNGDYEYVLFGVPQPDKSEAVVWENGRGKKKLDVYPPLYYEYKKPAGWKVGPMPEADPRHYPSDPENKLWEPHKEASKLVQRQANAKAPAGEAEALEGAEE